MDSSASGRGPVGARVIYSLAKRLLASQRTVVLCSLYHPDEPGSPFVTDFKMWFSTRFLTVWIFPETYKIHTFW